ncbi:maltotransferase domain-containing protein, partial [Streptomyces aureus]
MPATHHTSPPPTTTPDTPRTSTAEAGPRTPAAPVAPATPEKRSPSGASAPGASASGARRTRAGTTGPGSNAPAAGSPAAGTSATASPEPSSADAADARTSPRRGTAPRSKTAGSAPRTAKAAVPKAAKSAAPKTAKAAPKSAKATAKAAKSAPEPVKAATRTSRASVPATRTPDAADGPLAPAAPVTAVGRIPVLDVRPLVQNGRRPAKAVVGEEFEVSATVFREGHDAVAANVVLRDPEGRPGPWAPMRELAPGTDRWGAKVSAGAEGRWTYVVEAWSDPVTTWRHHAGIKIPAGLDTELVLEEGALLYERAAAGLPEGARAGGSGRTLAAAVDALRDTDRPVASRLAAALTPEVDAVLAEHPLRELVTSSEPLPLLVERERALYGAWYEFFPRSEGPSGSESLS